MIVKPQSANKPKLVKKTTKVASKTTVKTKKSVNKADNPSPKSPKKVSTTNQLSGLGLYFGGKSTQISEKELKDVFAIAEDKAKMINDNKAKAAKFAKVMFSFDKPIQVLVRATPLSDSFKSDVTKACVIVTCLTEVSLYTETISFENLDQALSYVDEYNQYALNKFCERALAKK